MFPIFKLKIFLYETTFSGCSSLTSLEFLILLLRCITLTSLAISNFETFNVDNLKEMPSECKNLSHLDISGFTGEGIAKGILTGFPYSDTILVNKKLI